MVLRCSLVHVACESKLYAPKTDCLDDVDDARASKGAGDVRRQSVYRREGQCHLRRELDGRSDHRKRARQVDTNLSLISCLSGRRESALGLIDNEQCCKTNTIDGAPDDVRRA